MSIEWDCYVMSVLVTLVDEADNVLGLRWSDHDAFQVSAADTLGLYGSLIR